MSYQISSGTVHNKAECEVDNVVDLKEEVELPEHIQKNSVELEDRNETEKYLDNGKMTEKAQDKEKLPLSEDLLFCRKCGMQLLTDSIYCDKCGTKVEHL